MAPRAIAVVLTALILLPFTAPFATFDPAESRCAHHALAATPQFDHSIVARNADDATPSQDRGIYVRRGRLTTFAALMWMTPPPPTFAAAYFVKAHESTENSVSTTVLRL